MQVHKQLVTQTDYIAKNDILESIRQLNSNLVYLYVKSESKKTAYISKLAISKSPTIFVISSWNFVKISTSWVDNFDKVS